MLASIEAVHAPAPGTEVETAYRDHAAALHRFALSLTRDPGVAEDIVQDAFARLATEVGAGRGPDNVRAWLHRVAANLVTSRGRRLQVADRHLSSLVNHGLASSPESVVIDGERSLCLRDALDTLPPTDRRAVVLAAQGYRGPEIAVLIGRTEGATRTLLCRARSRLRDQMIEAGVA